jgi:riboflavin synthase
MFTGIIEGMSEILDVEEEQTNLHITFKSTFTPELKVDQSVSHNGICLTVTNINIADSTYKVTAIAETQNVTSIKSWKIGDFVNTERCMPATGRFDGHIVQGHVDCVGVLDEIHDLEGSYMLFISHPPEAGLTVNKGSICINGISLTVVDSFPDAFSVAIIPYTWEHTNLKFIKAGDPVNLEFDVIGKYLQRLDKLRNT